MFSSLEFYSQPVKYESKISKFSECTVSTFFPFTCSSSGIYVLPKQIKLREEGIEPREKRNSMQKIENLKIMVKGDSKQELSFNHADMGSQRLMTFVFRRMILMLNVCVYSERRFAQLGK